MAKSRKKPGRKNRRMTAKKRMGVALLLGGKTQAEVAAALGVDDSTVWRWVNRDDRFREELDRRLDDYEQAIVRALLSLALKALDRLEGDLHLDQGGASNDQIGNRTARWLIDLIVRVIRPEGALPDTADTGRQSEAAAAVETLVEQLEKRRR